MERSHRQPPLHGKPANLDAEPHTEYRATNSSELAYAGYALWRGN